MNIGIDKISFYTPNQFIDMKDLAYARDVDPNKFTIGLGQDEMSVIMPSQDPVTMAANAAYNIIDQADKEAINLVIFATETGLDFSKALSVYVRDLLEIQPYTRVIELKEACYSGTAALQMAKSHIAMHPDKKVLVLTSDISYYGLNTPGEPTQGSGAVAILLSQDPKLLIIEDETSYYTEESMDFWRPYYSETAFVDGKHSNDQYQKLFLKTYENYLDKYKRTLADFKALTFHLPYTKIGLKALQAITEEERMFDMFKLATRYNRRIGNAYTGSLFISLISLLDAKALREDDRIGLYSYGSGSVAEFYSVRVVKDYEKHLYPNHEKQLNDRTQIDIPTYEKMYTFKYPTDGSEVKIDTSIDTGEFVISHARDHKRFYTKKQSI